MLRLWTFIPYRQRNIREMRLHENLYHDHHGKWRIKFVGEQMKVAARNGKPTVFDLPFPTQLTSVLEEYLRTWRPILAKQTNDAFPHVFLQRNGLPYRTESLRRGTGGIVYSFTGQHWHPHIIRSVWATEWIRKTHGDFYTAAVMLNDKLETVIASYAHLLEEDVAEKAYTLIHERNGTHS
jgi:hypothetical protein